MLVRFLGTAAAIAISTWLIPGIALTDAEPQNKVLAILAVAVIFGLVNAIVKPLFQFAAAPLILLTLGLFLMVINGLLLLLTSWVAEQLGLGWHVDGWWSAFWGALVVSIVSFLLNAFVRKGDEQR
ncbi:MAG: phage holin family protein [Micropruina sp.]|nr:phage holin family protein [Micropruina sp.]